VSEPAWGGRSGAALAELAGASSMPTSAVHEKQWRRGIGPYATSDFIEGLPSKGGSAR